MCVLTVNSVIDGEGGWMFVRTAVVIIPLIILIVVGGGVVGYRLL